MSSHVVGSESISACILVTFPGDGCLLKCENLLGFPYPSFISLCVCSSVHVYFCVCVSVCIMHTFANRVYLLNAFIYLLGFFRVMN